MLSLIASQLWIDLILKVRNVVLAGFWDWGWLRVPGWLGWGWGAQGRIGWCLTNYTVLVHSTVMYRGFHGFHFKSKYEAEDIQTFDHPIDHPSVFFPFLLKLYHESEMDSDDSLTNQIQLTIMRLETSKNHFSHCSPFSCLACQSLYQR